MARLAPGGASNFRILAGMGLFLMTSVGFSGAPQTQTPLRPASSASHARAKRPTWQTGPAWILPETEVVPSHRSSVPPPLRAQTLSVQGERKGNVRGKTGDMLPAGSTLAVNRTTAAPHKSEVTTVDESAYPSAYVDPEKRAQGELNCLRSNYAARQAFYEYLRHTVERVRAGEVEKASPDRLATCPP